MSLNKISNSEIKKRDKSPTNLDTIKTHITSDEIDNNPVIKNILKKIKKIKLNPVASQKPNLTPTKNIKDEKQLKLIKNLNSFHQIIYDYNKNQKVPKKMEQKVYTGQKNYNFSKLYNQVKEINNFAQKEMLEDIKKMYLNKNLSVPSLDQNNLFKDNLLLLNENNIKNMIDFKITTEKSNNNSLSYLKAMEKNINNQIIGKNYQLQFPKLTRDILLTRKNILKKKNIKFPKKPKNDIISIKETINDINDLDYFFKSNNQQYFNYLKDPESIKNSKDSSLFLDKSINKNNSNDNMIDIYKLKVKKTNNSNFKKNNYNKPISEVNNNNRQINIYNPDSNSNFEKINLNKNYSMDNIDTNKKILIRLKKIDLNRKIESPSMKNTNASKNINKIKSKSHLEEVSRKHKKRLSMRNQKFNSIGKLTHILPNYNLRDSLSKKKLNKNNNQKQTLENIYNKIKIKDNYLKSKDLVNNYFKNKSLNNEENNAPIDIVYYYKNIEENNAPIDIVYYYKNIKENIFGNDCFKKYIKLKDSSGFDESSYENIKNEYDIYKNKFKGLANNVNKVVSNL